MNLEDLRKEIDKVDINILNLLSKRKALAKKIFQIKREQRILVYDEKREKEITDKLKEKAKASGLNKDFIEGLYQLILENSKKEQER